MKAELWREVAACKGRFAELDFFSEAASERKKCKAVCAQCQGRSGCLDYAVETQQTLGIWGGMTPAQRARVRKRK